MVSATPLKLPPRPPRTVDFAQSAKKTQSAQKSESECSQSIMGRNESRTPSCKFKCVQFSSGGISAKDKIPTINNSLQMREVRA